MTLRNRSVVKRRKYLKKNQSKIEEEIMKRWEEEAARWKKQQEEAKEVDMSEDASDEQIAELMEKMMKASAEDVPKIAEQIQVMLRKQGSKANKRSNSRARATKREADDASGEEETAAKKKAKAENRSRAIKLKREADEEVRRRMRPGPYSAPTAKDETDGLRLVPYKPEQPKTAEEEAQEKAENRKQAMKMRREADEEVRKKMRISPKETITAVANEVKAVARSVSVGARAKSNDATRASTSEMHTRWKALANQMKEAPKAIHNLKRARSVGQRKTAE